MTLNPEEWSGIEANIFPSAAEWVKTQGSFPWHRDQTGQVTADRPHSSQALAIDVFGTIKGLGDVELIVDAWADRLALPRISQPQLALEYTLPRELLGEPRPSQIDVAVEGTDGLFLLECKFTEPDGGACSQVVSLRRRGPPIVQCSGDYMMQTNPVNGVESRCALSGKGIRYWDLIPRVLDIQASADHQPCPFRGGWYQWMRNLVACAALSDERGLPGAVVIVYPEGPFPMASKIAGRDWLEFRRLVEGQAVPLATLSYQVLLDTAVEAASYRDRPTLEQLRSWVLGKIASVGSAA